MRYPFTHTVQVIFDCVPIVFEPYEECNYGQLPIRDYQPAIAKHYPRPKHNFKTFNEESKKLRGGEITGVVKWRNYAHFCTGQMVHFWPLLMFPFVPCCA